MPITKSAKKAVRSSARKRIFNLRRKRAMSDLEKGVRKLASSEQGQDIETRLSAAYRAIDKAAKRGVIKKNTAARKKSRLVAALRKSGS